MIDVETLPRRTAHAVHALMEARNGDSGPYGPFTAYEVCLYDAEALNARSTAAALTHAQSLGLAMYVPGGEGYWTATNRALEQRRDFETRYLHDTASDAENSQLKEPT